jgi:hypothetical protein
MVCFYPAHPWQGVMLCKERRSFADAALKMRFDHLAKNLRIKCVDTRA